MGNSSAWMENIDISDMEKLEGKDAESLIYVRNFPNGATGKIRLDQQGSVVALIKDPFHEYAEEEPLNFRSNIDDIDYELETEDLAKYTDPGNKYEIDELMNHIWHETVSYR